MSEDELVIQVAGAGDVAALAELRALWATGAGADAEFTERMVAWLSREGERRTTWLAAVAGRAVGIRAALPAQRLRRAAGDDHGRPAARAGPTRRQGPPGAGL